LNRAAILLFRAVTSVAVSRGPGTDAIYAAHARWLREVLGPGDSLFTPGTPVWTREHLDELEVAFVAHPDLTPGRRYEEKLRGQLAGVSPEAKQLMAELHAVHFLMIWVGAISAATKLGIINTILAWMPAPPDVPAEVAEAMSPGLVHPGTWVMTRRDTQITWLIRFSAAWKRLSEEAQQALAADPWKLKEFTGQVDAPSAGGAQMALLHLAHPETFDPTVSADHKRWITSRFADVAGTSPDVDRRMLAAREALTPQYGEGFNWYGDWLVRLWWKNGKDWKLFLAWLERSRADAGSPAPETGRLLESGDEAFLADEMARIRRAWQLAGWGAEPEGASLTYTRGRLLAFLDELIRDSQPWAAPLRDRPEAYAAVRHLAGLTGRPAGWSDSEWDVLAGRLGLPPQPRPGPDEEEDDIPPGPLVDHIAAAAKELNVDRSALDEIKELLDDKGQVVLYGPPGTGKTHLAVRLAAALADGDEDRVSVVQFHPATTYEDFFEGLRPAVTPAGQVTYQRTSGPLVTIAEKAARYEAEYRTFILVIDEINRANLPKVFGELLYLLENRNKPVQTLYRPAEPFRLPTNLKIIGTMNTADRSIALIDAAMRRRFHFVPFFPHEGMMKDLLRRWLADGNGSPAIADFLDAVNADLLPLVGEHLLIGPSHFMRPRLSQEALRRIWDYNVFPLIEEQLWGDQDTIGRWRWEQVRARYSHILAGKPAQADTGDEEAAGDEPASP
jgi:5-methylcytosine-specific restriction protein B